ncbi:MAG: response regulator [Lachnospiraceae bacterium]|nr:response regulator [Lachnospiraceae bacterium]
MKKTYGLYKKLICFQIMAALLVGLFLVPEIPAIAKDTFMSKFIQTVYNQNNGIGSNEVNCIYQSSSGYIWFGTDGGLYRSNGSSFQSINLWDTDRTDVYTINCIIQDKEGRMWIGTDNYGLFYIESGETYHLQDEYYNGIKQIHDVCQTEEGDIYVATSQGLFLCNKNENGNMVLNAYADSDIASMEFSEIEFFKGNIWAISGTDKIYILEENDVRNVVDTSDILSDELTSLDVQGEYIYFGSTGQSILRYSNVGKYKILTASIEGINSVMQDSNGYVWVCADNGVGYFLSEGSFVKINDCEIDSYLSDMIQDYEGNYWISSTRMGVLLLSRSKFTDFNMYVGMQETMVNAVHIYGNHKYIGTDDGLIIYDSSNERINNELTDMLNGISVRHITNDSNGNIWISTYRKYGLVKVSYNGSISYYDRGDNLPSIVTNCSLVLQDGSVAVGTESGVAIIGADGVVNATFEEKDGITASVSCLYQGEDNKLYVGTDGSGIYAITLGVEPKVENYTVDDGLNSNVVTTIVKGNEGIWIGTDNGLCFYKDAFRGISNIEYSNSIYDVIITEETFWIIGSLGVLKTTEEELLGSQGISGRYFDSNDGLSKTLNSISNSTIDKNGILYVCCNNGIYTLDTNNIYYNITPPRIKVTAIDIDGVTYEFDDLADGLRIKSDVSRVTISFAVFSYGNREDIQVEYSLNGFDEQPIIISGTDMMQAVYTNLDGGVYEFVITASNGDGTLCESKVSFIIEKENSFFENPAARIGFLVLILIALALMIIGFIMLQKKIKKKNIALEQLSKEHEEAVKSSSAKNDYLANMSNEIKTPINAMMVKAEELHNLIGDNESYSDIIKSIYNTGNDIIGKVDDIILLAKIEAGKVDMIKAPYSISTMMYDLSEIVIQKIGERSVKFFVEIGENVTDMVIGDSEKIKDILKRILDNSIKFTKEGSITLSVDCYAYGDKAHHDIVNVVFTIADTGIGIQEERLESLFEIYNIADNVKNNPHSGNGVGLAIAKGYADLMDGEIEVESSYGAGSTFTFTLNQKVTDKYNQGHVVSKIEGTVSKETAEKLWLPEVNALLVDDDEVSREVSLKALSQFEMKIDVASSGVSAIDMALNNDYDVVFMDVAMPIMNGMEAMMEIRELADVKYSILPIIAMDTNAIEENKEELLSAGFTDSVLKPMDIKRVAAILKDCLPEDKIKEKANDIEQYIEESRYGEGLNRLREYLDIEVAIGKIGGSIDVFNKLIVAYYNQNANAIDELKEKVGKDIRGFKTKIHSLRTTSINIGAYDFAHQALKIEAAINIGNREYISNNIDELIDELSTIILAVEDYMDFIDGLSGVSDEELSQRNQAEKESKKEEKQVIDFTILESIKYSSLEKDFEEVDKYMNELAANEYKGDDNEFISVLKEAIEARNIETIDELVTTYMDLKM